MPEINEVLETVETVENVTPEVKPDPYKEDKEKLTNEIVKIFTICYRNVEKSLEGKALRNKFETIEQTLRKYRKREEENLSKIQAELDNALIEYKTAADEFEKMALEELDPTRYETNVAPKEARYAGLKRLYETKHVHIQSIKNLCTKMFARDKSIIPTLRHGQAVLLTMLIIRTYLLNGELDLRNTDNEEDVKTITDAVKNIVESPALVGDFEALPELETFIEYFNSVAECSVDKSANRAKEGKDASFDLINKICTKYEIQTIAPEKTDKMTDMEVEIIDFQNKLKLLSEAIKGKPIHNPDGTYSKPIPKSEYANIIDATRTAGLFLNGGALSLLDDVTINQLPFRAQGLQTFYRALTRGFAKSLYKDLEEKVPEYKWDMIVSWTLLSTSIVDHIPTLLLLL